MTRGEAVKMMKAALECLTRDIHGDGEICRPELCDSCPLNYEQGNLGQKQEWLRMAIEELSRWPLNIEMDLLKNDLWMAGVNLTGEYQGVWVRYRDISRIIDKHIEEGGL